MSRHVTGSALPLVLKCAASAALPRIGHAGGRDKMGSALHEHFRQRAIHGIDGAMSRLGELAAWYELDEKEAGILAARARHFTFSPPKGSLCELSLAMFEDGRVEVVQGGKGSYQVGGDARIALQIDCAWSEPEPLYRDAEGRVRCPRGSLLYVIDLKAGAEQWVDPVERNAQILGAALLVADFTGAEAVMPALVFWRPGPGVWDAPEAPLAREQLEKVREVLVAGVARANRQRDAYAAGEPLAFVEGPWCTYCASAAYCTAKIGALRAVLADPTPYRADEALSPEQLVRLAEMFPSLKRFVDSVEKALKTAVNLAVAPIPLGDGNVWGPHPVPKKRIDPTIVFPLLKGVVGEELARAALKITISQEAITDAVRAAHSQQGIKRAMGSTVKAIMAQSIEAGGVTYEPETWYGAYRPAPVLPPAPPEPSQLPPPALAALEDENGEGEIE